jgi:hypothetical protein
MVDLPCKHKLFLRLHHLNCSMAGQQALLHRNDSCPGGIWHRENIHTAAEAAGMCSP